MIEKVMRAVKSSNKKRGRNITIGAVVGILLSCTSVMKADDYLWIKNNNGVIEFSTKDGGGSGNPYPDNSWNGKTYTNNIALSGTDNGQDEYGNTIGYGLRLTGNLGENFNLVNNGSIVGSSSNSNLGFGVYLSDTTMRNIVNSGIISGSDFGVGLLDTTMGDIINTGTISGSNLGVYLLNTTMEDIVNNGIISGSGNYASGVYLDNTTMGDIVNTGIISGSDFGVFLGNTTMGDIINAGIISGSGNYTPGVYLLNTTMGDIVNTGIISGSRSLGVYLLNTTMGDIVNNGIISSRNGPGVYLGNTTMGDIVNTGIISGTGPNAGVGTGVSLSSNTTVENIENMANKGIIYGTTNAIVNNGGKISKAHNYGLLISGGAVIENVNGGITSFIGKYGLAFKIESDKYILDNNYSVGFGIFSKEGGYTIINAKAETKDSSSDVIGTESLVLADGKLTNYNYSEGEPKEEIIDSNKKYILNGITNTLEVTGRHNELNNSVINAYKTTIVMEGDSYLTLKNTIVNGGLDGIVDTSGKLKDYSPVISVTGDNNFLTIKGDSIVNGEMSATGDMNTLNLYGKENKTRDAENKSMNILHNIDGFGRIQIENEVTFFEDVKVTGVDRLNINNGGILNLRLKAGATSNDKATHALTETGKDLLIAGKEKGGSETAGTLNFITNGMGTGTIIDMNGAELENLYLRTSSILYELEVINNTKSSSGDVGDIELKTKGSLIDIYNGRDITPDLYPKYKVIPNEVLYSSLNKIYQSSVKDGDNVNGVTDMIDSTSGNEQWEKFLTFLGGVYTESPYSYSSELSRKSTGMFRDIVTENEFKPNLNNWLIMGGLTHTDGGTKDTYYGKNYYEIDSGSSSTNADMKLTGAYMLAKYGYSENTSLGLTLGGNKSEAKLDMSKVKGNSGYLGAFAENYRGNLTLKAGAGIQYSEYDADRRTIGGHSYNDKYSDMTYDIYLNGRYSNPIGDNLFLEPYGTLSYTYVEQDGANEGSKVLAIETDSKSFDYTVGKVGVDLKKVIPHSNGKSTLTAGVSYTKILDGAEEEYITGRFKGGTDFDILVAHKNEHSIGLNAKYALELENGVLFDVKGTYSVERDSHNNSGKNKTKGEWIVGAGIGYKF